jgi:outer membrane protein assembly factor BamB
LVFGGRIYIGAGGDLFCLDANGTGDGTTTRYWTAPIGGTVDSSPTTDGDDDIFIASGNARLKAIYTNGTEHWTSSINGGAACSPAYWNGRVYCGGGTWAGGNNNIYCFDADTGALIWSHKLDSPVCSSPTLAYGNVYAAGSGDVGGTGEFGSIYCLDAMGSGGATTEKWKHDIGGAYSSPAVGYGRVYIGSNTGDIYCLDAFGNGTGGTKRHWNKKFNDWSHCSPIITPKYVFTGSADGRFYCLNRADSSTVWSMKLGGDGLWGISSSPALAGNLIFVTCDGDGLYCVGAKKDVEPPKVVKSAPVPNATQVSADIEIEIVFNKAVVPSSISEISIILIDSRAQTVSGSVRSNTVGDTAYLKPNDPLKKNEMYTVTVTTDIVDLIGFHLDGDKDGIDEGAGIDEYTFSFTTAPLYPPYIAPIPTQRPLENSLFVLNISSYISDKDTAAENLTLEVSSSHISVEGFELHMLYPIGFTTEVVNLSVSDGDFPTPAYRDLVVEVVNGDYPPELTPVPPQNLSEDIPFELDLSPYIMDLDTPLSNITLKANSSYSKIVGLIINFTYPNGVRSDLVNVTVYDGEFVKYLEIIVKISPVNDAPVITEIPPVEVVMGVPSDLSLEDHISDIDNHIQELVITVDSPYIEVHGHVLRLTYPENVTEDALVVKVSDGQLFDNTTLIVRVYLANALPSLTNPLVTPDEGDIGTEFVFSVVFTDADIGERAPLVQLVIGEEKHPCVRASGDYRTGATFKFNTTLPEGEHTFHFTADDHRGGKASTEEMNITVSSEKDGNADGGSSIGLVIVAVVSLLIVAAVVIMLVVAEKKNIELKDSEEKVEEENGGKAQKDKKEPKTEEEKDRKRHRLTAKPERPPKGNKTKKRHPKTPG